MPRFRMDCEPICVSEELGQYKEFAPGATTYYIDDVPVTSEEFYVALGRFPQRSRRVWDETVPFGPEDFDKASTTCHTPSATVTLPPTESPSD